MPDVACRRSARIDRIRKGTLRSHGSFQFRDAVGQQIVGCVVRVCAELGRLRAARERGCPPGHIQLGKSAPQSDSLHRAPALVARCEVAVRVYARGVVAQFGVDQTDRLEDLP